MKKITFTKLVVAAVMVLYFIGAGIGVWVVAVCHEYIGELLVYIGAPTATAIGFYCWKAKAENEIKIRKALTKQQAALSKNMQELDCEKQTEIENINMKVDDILSEIDERSYL